MFLAHIRCDYLTRSSVYKARLQQRELESTLPNLAGRNNKICMGEEGNSNYIGITYYVAVLVYFSLFIFWKILNIYLIKIILFKIRFQ